MEKAGYGHNPASCLFELRVYSGVYSEHCVATLMALMILAGLVEDSPVWYLCSTARELLGFAQRSRYMVLGNWHAAFPPL
jgi:hypothetical protein